MDPEPILNSNIYENFMKKQFFNLNSNFDQLNRKKLKKPSYVAKLNSKIPKKYSNNIMSQIKGVDIRHRK